MSYKTTSRPIRVSDETVVRGYLKYREQFDTGLWQETADDVLKKMTKKPMRVIWRAMNRACNRGFVQFGVSLRTGWATEKGIALLSNAPDTCGETE